MTDTGAQAGVSNDVEARAREAIRSWWDDDIGEDERGAWLGRAMVSLLDHHSIRIVDAAEDDRRTAELAAGRELGHALVQWDMCAGKGTCNEAFVRIKAARRGFAPYLHDDDTGGEG